MKDSFFEKFYSQELNSRQREIVDLDAGIFVVHAGAGSGKTRVITARVAALILNKKVVPESLLALTFTNKAANEMKERVSYFLSSSGEYLEAGFGKPFIGTFHSYCLKLLKKNSRLLEMPDFSIIDEADKNKLVKGIIENYSAQKQISVRKAVSLISNFKNSSVNGLVKFEKIRDNLFRDIFLSYEKEKSASKGFDFDDLLLQALRLFKEIPDFKFSHQQKIRHVLVDEFQDTNLVQHTLLKEMVSTDGEFVLDSLCVVGDEDQSIYSWRGAVPEKMLSFRKDFSDIRTFTLEENYRSSSSILSVANTLIKNNSCRNPKELRAVKDAKAFSISPGSRVLVQKYSSSYQESEAFAILASQLKSIKGSLKSFAVLYRSHFQSRSLEEALIRHSLPYTVVGGVQFYNRQEIKDVLAYIKLLVNPFDRISFLRVINCPLRGFGKKFQELFLKAWEDNAHMNFMEVVDFIIKEALISNSKIVALKKFLDLFKSVSKNLFPAEIVEHFIYKVDYFAYLEKVFELDELKDRVANVKELVHSIRSKEEMGLNSAEKFLEEVALMQEREDPSAESDRVYLMTMHAAKGLEFDTVMVSGLEEGVLPSGRSIQDPEVLEEERRLLYVGITRARERLLLGYSCYRYIFGHMNEQLPSRFIKELSMDGNFFELDASGWLNVQLASCFRKWVNFEDISKISFGSTGVDLEGFSGKFSKKSLNRKKDFHSVGGFRVNQKIKHAFFGVGVIDSIQKKGEGVFYLSVRFGSGLKKIDSKFVRSL